MKRVYTNNITNLQNNLLRKYKKFLKSDKNETYKRKSSS